MTNKIELDHLLNDKFGLTVMGGRRVEPPISIIDQSPALLERERELVAQIKRDGSAVYGLDTPTNIDFTMALGSYARVILLLPVRRPQGIPYSAHATLTPDTDYFSNRMRIAFLGRLSGASADIPWQYDPENIGAKDSTINLYLSAANHMGTVGEHNVSQRISVTDPRHLLNAMAEFNVGSVANRAIQSSNEAQRSHIGDSWEQQNRGMFPIISAQDMRNPQNDLVWAPFTFTPLITRERVLPFGVKLTTEILDQNALAKDRIVPLRADASDALEEIQRMGFATILQKKTIDQLTRRVGQRLV